MAEAKAGLRGVVAGQSSIAFIDGQAGILVYRGIDIHELAVHSTFEETAYLLWFGRLPRKSELDELTRSLRAQYAIPGGVVDLLRGLPQSVAPMEALRTGVSALSGFDPDGKDMSREANVRKSIRLTAQFGTLVAAIERVRRGQPLLEPEPHRSVAANFLYLLNGGEPIETAVRALDTALILHADHGLNASTFAARVCASTLSDIHSAITAAVATLKGPLHGGANEKVMEMLLEIGSLDQADPWVEQALAARRLIMGMGHAVYKTEDPRATHLRRMSRELGERAGQPVWYRISERIEQTVKQKKGLNANVDFYSASTYHVLGLPIDLYTPIFAVARIAGWTAHVLEQYADNRLIRPDVDYVGATNVPYVPLAERG